MTIYSNQQQRPLHIHNYVVDSKYVKVCSECGKKKLRIYKNKQTGVHYGRKSNGVVFGKKSDQNRFFLPDDYLLFEGKLKGSQHHTITFLLQTGARINEARHVLVSDVDFKNNRITLRITKTKAKKGESHGRTRTIPISTDFSRYLMKYAKNNKLSEASDFKLMTKGGVKLGMKKAAIEAGLKDPHDFSAHTLRKTLEMYLLGLGVSDLTLAKHFGHDIKTASNNYLSGVSFSPREQELIQKIIGDLYRKSNPGQY